MIRKPSRRDLNRANSTTLRRLVAGLRDVRASIAVLFGIGAPVLLLLVAGGVEFAEVVKARRELQWNVDTAALNGAREFGTDQSSATAARARIFAASLAAKSTPRWTVDTTAAIDAAQGSMTVSQTAWRPSFFGSLLPPGGWHLGVTSTATINQRVPLCVLSLRGNGAGTIALKNGSALTADQCLVQSDSTIAVDPAASLRAAAVRSVGAAKGAITPPAITDAPAIADPFAALDIEIPKQCTDHGVKLSAGAQSLNPGVHCGDINLSGSAVVTLNPGEHYFLNGQFKLADTSQVVGADVVLVFKGNWQLKCQDDAYVSLTGRQTGPFAGFVLVTDRSFGGKLSISTDHARQLHGTIYLPNATLDVTGTGNKVADQSPWTVVVAKAVTTDGSADLVINSNYAASSVPVPPGVGTGGMAHLSD